MQCWDDERVDPTRTINRILNGVFHHPAQRMMGEDGAADGRRMMFGVVEQWWRSANLDELRRKLSREGVQNMENHLEGVHDTGHGCGKPLGMAKNVGGPSSPIGQAASGLMGALTGAAGQGGGASGIGKFAEEAVGGGALGGLVGALAGGVGGSLLSGAFGSSSSNSSGRQDPETRSFASSGRTQQGGYQQSYTELGRSGDQYAQAQYSETQLPGGGRETDYQRFQQQSEYGSGFEERTEQRPTHGGGYEQTTERVYQTPGEVETETWREGRTADGRHYHEAHPEIRNERRGSDSGSDDSRRRKHHHKKHHGRGESGDVRGENYIVPSNAYGGSGGGAAYGETFEERRHEREFESQPAGYNERAAPRGAFEDEGSGNRFEEQRREGYGSGYGSGSREQHGNEAGWGEERVREEDAFGGRRREGGYGERQQEEYREEAREQEYREEEYREETSEGGRW